MSPTATPSLLWRIRDVLHSLSKSERRLAEVVLDFPGDIASYSASELARLANVSNATVTRFIKRLGYGGYDEARRSVRAEHGSGSPLFLAGSSRSAPLGSLAAHIQQSVANIDGTFRRLSEKDIELIAGHLIDARKVWIVGFRASHGLAYYLRWQISQVLETVTLIPGAGETLAENIANMRNNDVVVVIGLRRVVAILPHLMEQSLKAGAKVVLITNAQADDSLPATWVLRCDTRAPGPLDNHVAAMLVCHMLATRVIELSGAAGRKRLATTETVHEALSEL